MRIAITGGTGFLGGHLADLLVEQGHEVILLARGVNSGATRFENRAQVTVLKIPLTQTLDMVTALKGCDAVVHCAGINREKGEQTFQAVHLDGTRHLLSAMRQVEVKRLIHISFLRARPQIDSPYHVSKWQAEEMVRNSGLNYTIFKPGVIYGPGDQFLTKLKKTLNNLPFFGLVGFTKPPISPLCVHDFTRTLAACIPHEQSIGKTYAIVGPEQLTLAEMVDLTADTIDIIPQKIPLPIFVHRLAGLVMEMFMDDPLLTSSQVTMLSESLSESALPCDELPAEFRPQSKFLTRSSKEVTISP